jgi:PIN domain nuclease of toxin-antitoxin system
MVVLDASALLAYLFCEEGHERVAEIIDDSCLSTVNLSEVIGRFVRDGHDGPTVLRRLAASPIKIVTFSAADASRAASLIPKTERLGLSLGDRACLALAMTRGIPAVTADRSWKRLALGIPVRVIR